MDEAARHATVDDLESVTLLAEAAIDELTPHRGGTLWRRTAARREPVADSLRRALDDPDQLVVAGTIDGVVVGYAVVRDEALADGGHLGLLDDLYTEPEARAVGVGEAMMDVVLAWCHDRGCIGVDSVALPGDRETKNFFESFGMVARAITVHRRLDDG